MNGKGQRPLAPGTLCGPGALVTRGPCCEELGRPFRAGRARRERQLFTQTWGPGPKVAVVFASPFSLLASVSSSLARGPVIRVYCEPPTCYWGSAVGEGQGLPSRSCRPTSGRWGKERQL